MKPLIFVKNSPRKQLSYDIQRASYYLVQNKGNTKNKKETDKHYIINVSLIQRFHFVHGTSNANYKR